MKIKRTLCGLLSVLLCLSLVIGMAPMIPAVSASGTEVTPTGLGSCAGHSHAEATPLAQADIDAQIASKSKVELANKTYYLTEDINVSTILYLVATTHLCLNGQTITFTNAGGFVQVYTNAIASVCDCVGGGTITRTSGVSSGNPLVYVGSATFDLWGGIISGNTCTGNGGGIKADGGTTNMHGGWITGNTASGSLGGGGVFVNTNGTFKMYNGYISANSASNGAGVYSRGTNGVTANGGYIFSNTASATGGGLYTSTKATLDGCTISSNRAVTAGGVFNSGTLTMKKGQISNNHATSDTGAVQTASFTMEGGSITGNTCDTTNPGGVKVTGAGSFVMTGGEISGNGTVADVRLINTSTAAISGSVVLGILDTYNNGSAHKCTTTITNLKTGASITRAKNNLSATIISWTADQTAHPNAAGYIYNLACDTQARMVLGSSLNIQFKLPDTLASAAVKVNGEAATAVDGIVTVYRNPAQMAEDIVLTIGDYTYTDSVQKYAERQIAKEGTTQALKNVLIDMLNYGAAAQAAYPDYTTATTTPGVSESSTTEVPDFEKESGTASLILSDGIALRVGVTAAEGTAATYTFTSWDGEEYTVNTQVLKEGNTMYVLADKIAVADAFEKVTVKVGAETVSDSVAAYCNRKANDVKVGALCEALLKFAAAAQAYLAA